MLHCWPLFRHVLKISSTIRERFAKFIQRAFNAHFIYGDFQLKDWNRSSTEINVVRPRNRLHLESITSSTNKCERYQREGMICVGVSGDMRRKSPLGL